MATKFSKVVCRWESVKLVNRVENIVANGEIACLGHFLLGTMSPKGVYNLEMVIKKSTEIYYLKENAEKKCIYTDTLNAVTMSPYPSIKLCWKLTCTKVVRFLPN